MGHTDSYRLWLLPEGWYVAHIAICGPTDRFGMPTLLKNLDRDSIEYPPGLPKQMAALWHDASAQALSSDEVRQRLESIGVSIRQFNGGQ